MLHNLRPVFAAALLAGCSLTPIPDLTSEWLEPCDTSSRLCPVEFRMRAGTERTVELRGDFRADGWTAGVPMERQGESWTATAQVSWGAAVQYKFFVDGNRWVLDPGNPKTVRDAQGNTNSLLENVSCSKWTCKPPGG